MALKSGRVGIHPSQVDPITGMLLSSPSGSTNYNDLSNKPQINGVTLSGNKTTSDLHIEAGASDLSDLDDVSIDNPEVGQQLIYDGNKWENQFASISPLSLAQLRDVEITDLQDGDFITYDSTSEKWVNTGEAPGPTVILQSVTIYSAVEDVISYTDIYGATQTEAFAANSDHKTITVDIYEGGSNITFISSVAKDPDNLSNAYSKSVTITEATTAVYVMPSSDKVLYWYGYMSSNLETCSSTNGWTHSAMSYVDPTYNKNNVSFTTSTNQLCGIGTKNTVTATKWVAIGLRTSNSNAFVLASKTNPVSKSTSGPDVDTVAQFTSTSTEKVQGTATISTTYSSVRFANGTNGTCYAFWYE